MKRVFELDGPLDLGLTLRPLAHGRGDPTIRLTANEVIRATRTPEGPGTQHVRVVDGAVEAEAWGPGATWLLEKTPALVGMDDQRSDFDPRHRGLRDLHRRFPGLRVGRSEAVVEAIVPYILEQKVTGTGARRSYRGLVKRYSEPAPGPWSLLLPPDPKVLMALPYEAFHPFSVERKRAVTVKIACSYAHRLEETVDMEPDLARRRVLALPGVGEWTLALVAGTAWGDADAVEVGDLHVPNSVAWFLAGEPRGTDERMLELLEPFAGHRGRVIRLIGASGVRAPRYGPRYSVADLSKI